MASDGTKFVPVKIFFRVKKYDFLTRIFKFFENFPTLPGDHNVARAARPDRFLYKGGVRNLYHEVVEISHSNTDHPDKGDKELNDTDHPARGTRNYMTRTTPKGGQANEEEAAHP